MRTPYRLASGTQNELEPRNVTFSAEAATLYWEFSDEAERQQLPGGEYDSISAFASKLAEHAARLSAAGFDVRTVPAGELAKAEGGVTCCSLLLRV